MTTTAGSNGPVSTIADAIACMEKIGSMVEVDPDDPAPPPHQDGLICFNHLYLQVTRKVDEWLKQGLFEDAEFMTELDVAFANRYFEAIDAWNEGRMEDVPRVWYVILDRRGNVDIASIQFAVAGVNAHINLDLSVALVQTCRKIGCDLIDGDARHRDYERINEIFKELFASLREDFTHGRFERWDEGDVEERLNKISHFMVDKARDAAWLSAKVLSALGAGAFADHYVRVLDSTFGFAAQGFLR